MREERREPHRKGRAGKAVRFRGQDQDLARDPAEPGTRGAVQDVHALQTPSHQTITRSSHCLTRQFTGNLPNDRSGDSR